MATQRIQKGSFAIDKILYDFIENEALPLSNVSSDEFWAGFEAIVKISPQKTKPCLPAVMSCKRRLMSGMRITPMNLKRINSFSPTSAILSRR